MRGERPVDELRPLSRASWSWAAAVGGAVRDSGCTRVTACVFHVLLENSQSALPGYVQYEFFNIGMLFVLNFLFLNTVTCFVRLAGDGEGRH